MHFYIVGNLAVEPHVSWSKVGLDSRCRDGHTTIDGNIYQPMYGFPPKCRWPITSCPNWGWDRLQLAIFGHKILGNFDGSYIYCIYIYTHYYIMEYMVIYYDIMMILMIFQSRKKLVLLAQCSPRHMPGNWQRKPMWLVRMQPRHWPQHCQQKHVGAVRSSMKYWWIWGKFKARPEFLGQEMFLRYSCWMS